MANEWLTLTLLGLPQVAAVCSWDGSTATSPADCTRSHVMGRNTPQLKHMNRIVLSYKSKASTDILMVLIFKCELYPEANASITHGDEISFQRNIQFISKIMNYNKNVK